MNSKYLFSLLFILFSSLFFRAQGADCDNFPDIKQPSVIEGCLTTDLTLKDAEIKGDYTSFQVSYYNTENDAKNAINPISNPQSYKVDNPDVIVYARVLDPETNCYGITTIRFKDTKPPSISGCTSLKDGFFEDRKDTEEKVGEWNLNNIKMLNNCAVDECDSQGDFTVTSDYDYSKLKNTGDCEKTMNVTYRVSDYAGNISIMLLKVTVSSLPVINKPSALTKCDDDYHDGRTEFYLSSKTKEITKGNSNLEVVYYRNLYNAENEKYALPNKYRNSVNDKETIYARVIHKNNSNCFAITSLDLVVIKPVSSSFKMKPNCTGATAVIHGDKGGFFMFSEYPKDDAVINSVTGEITNATPGETYWVRYLVENKYCMSKSFENVTVLDCGFGEIKISTFLDENKNGIKDNNEVPFLKGKLSYIVNNDGNVLTKQSKNGEYLIYSQDETNSYDITYILNEKYAAYYSIENTEFKDIVAKYKEKKYINIPVVLVKNYNDVEVNLISLRTPRPGFEYYNKLVIENKGSQSISGKVTYFLDENSEFIGVENLPDEAVVNQVDGGFVVDFKDLSVESRLEGRVMLKLSAEAELGSKTINKAVIELDNDIYLKNNEFELVETVIGSYDPNDIIESHGPEILYNSFTKDDYLYYTIRFQNIGTAEAINVRIENNINSLLDVSTLELLNASHNMQLTQDASSLIFNFDAINLPGESQNEPESHGYVNYKIKPKSGYKVGTIIPNKASIYFDFNAPVITNKFETKFTDKILSLKKNYELDFTVYPNPVSDKLTITSTPLNQARLTLITIHGKEIINSDLSFVNEKVKLDVSQLPKGMYFIKLKSENKSAVKKLIIK